jgi:hypothetical protein
MIGYIGETVVDIKKTIYAHYEKHDWAMLWIEMHNEFYENSQKDWLTDQISRILQGNKIIMKEAKWKNGNNELRFTLAEPTEEYLKWSEEIKDWEL